jgi:inner membrane protein
MYSSGHLGISWALYSPILFAFLFFNMYTVAVLGAIIVMFLASAPDADMKFQYKSTVFHKIPIVKRFVPDIKHRGITHSVWFMLAIGVVLSIAGFFVYPLLDVLFIIERPFFTLAMFFFGSFGILTHVLGDYITPTGINIMYPNGTTRVFTVHSSNKFLFSFRPRSEVRNEIRDEGVLTVAASSTANYVANMIGVICIGVAIAFSILIASETLPVQQGIISFAIAFLALIFLPILLAQWREVFKYVNPF